MARKTMPVISTAIKGKIPLLRYRGVELYYDSYAVLKGDSFKTKGKISAAVGAIAIKAIEAIFAESEERIQED